ncbi:hypothetical protein DPEC_G00162550 [Dallia pectoralis]|uniref:Uncharacterized protein n=1 Tax=Dallia pectoralis TaxID=75939 RepID=A0ACC2GGJ8_DALPE|nr:hypothetical protein DPEC_G00162550 [Dallia pectoralis]
MLSRTTLQLQSPTVSYVDASYNTKWKVLGSRVLVSIKPGLIAVLCCGCTCNREERDTYKSGILLILVEISGGAVEEV